MPQYKKRTSSSGNFFPSGLARMNSGVISDLHEVIPGMNSISIADNDDFIQNILFKFATSFIGFKIIYICVNSCGAGLDLFKRFEICSSSLWGQSRPLTICIQKNDGVPQDRGPFLILFFLRNSSPTSLNHMQIKLQASRRSPHLLSRRETSFRESCIGFGNSVFRIFSFMTSFISFGRECFASHRCSIAQAHRME